MVVSLHRAGNMDGDDGGDDGSGSHDDVGADMVFGGDVGDG